MSEFGFQGFPDLKTLDSASCRKQKPFVVGTAESSEHPRGMELIRTYMEREFNVPENFGDYAYVSQLVQAYGIKKAIEAHRRAMPRCMGTLYWQLNDCWPVISWSSADDYNRWKALHYFVREVIKMSWFLLRKIGDQVNVFIVSDKREDFQARLYLQIMDFGGKVKWQKNDSIMVSGGTSKIYGNAEVTEISKTDHLLIARVMVADSVIAGNLYYLLPAGTETA